MTIYAIFDYMHPEREIYFYQRENAEQAARETGGALDQFDAAPILDRLPMQDRPSDDWQAERPRVPFNVIC